MTSIPAEFYALANAFLFALHNMFTKKALRYSNPATAVISSLLINILFLWGVSILFVPLSSLTSASILIFVVVGFFQPGLTRLLSYKGIDALGVAITDPIRATTPLVLKPSWSGTVPKEIQSKRKRTPPGLSH